MRILCVEASEFVLRHLGRICHHPPKPIRLGMGDKGYDAEKNHELRWEELHAMSIIPTRQEDLPVWRTRGRYRKEMKRGY